jgi:hypothetical protein
MKHLRRKTPPTRPRVHCACRNSALGQAFGWRGSKKVPQENPAMRREESAL